MISEIWIFIRRHWVHALLCVPGAILVTVLHEAAHALAAWIQGGTLLEFSWLPWASKGHWGYVMYDFPADAVYSPFAISVAPYVLWIALACIAWMLSLRHKAWSYGSASTVYFWLYFVPLADIANTALPWMRGAENDFLHAFGQASGVDCLMMGFLAFGCLYAGYGIQARLYGDGRLSMAAYGWLCGLSLSAILAVSGMF